MKKYTVCLVGLGKRGLHHLKALEESPRFEVVGIADSNLERLRHAAALAPRAASHPDAWDVLRDTRPDMLCFCTPPAVRLELVRIGVECGVRLIAFEKPIAQSLSEAVEIRALLQDASIPAVVCHQHRYGKHYQRVSELIASGALGRIHTVYATAVGWMLHMMPHLVEYIRWFNDYADIEWVMAQAVGRSKLADDHPSPDYIGGFLQFSNGVRGVLESGVGAPDVPEVDYWWRKNRIGAIGSSGFAEVMTGAGWRAVTERGSWSGTERMSYDLDMPPYIADIARWLDDPTAAHPCEFMNAFKTHEVMMALCRSAATGQQVSLPLAAGADEIAELRRSIAPADALPSSRANLAYYQSAGATVHSPSRP